MEYIKEEPPVHYVLILSPKSEVETEGQREVDELLVKLKICENIQDC